MSLVVVVLAVVVMIVVEGWIVVVVVVAGRLVAFFNVGCFGYVHAVGLFLSVKWAVTLRSATKRTTNFFAKDAVQEGTDKGSNDDKEFHDID